MGLLYAVLDYIIIILLNTSPCSYYNGMRRSKTTSVVTTVYARSLENSRVD